MAEAFSYYIIHSTSANVIDSFNISIDTDAGNVKRLLLSQISFIHLCIIMANLYGSAVS